MEVDNGMDSELQALKNMMNAMSAKNSALKGECDRLKEIEPPPEIDTSNLEQAVKQLTHQIQSLEFLNHQTQAELRQARSMMESMEQVRLSLIFHIQTTDTEPPEYCVNNLFRYSACMCYLHSMLHMIWFVQMIDDMKKKIAELMLMGDETSAKLRDQVFNFTVECTSELYGYDVYLCWVCELRSLTSFRQLAAMEKERDELRERIKKLQASAACVRTSTLRLDGATVGSRTGQQPV